MARKVSWGVLGVAKIGVEKVIPAMQLGALAASMRSPHATSKEPRARPPRSASPEPMAPTRNCSPIPRSKPSTIRCRMNCTRPGLCGRWRRASMCSAKSRSRSTPTKRKALVDARQRSASSSPRPSWSASIRNGGARVNLLRSGAIGQLRAIQTFFSYHLLDPDQYPQQAAGRRRALRHRLLRHADRPLHISAPNPCASSLRSIAIPSWARIASAAH